MANNVIGLDKLLKRLTTIAGTKAVMQGIQKGALRVEATAKQNCAVDTGLLRASITHKLKLGSLSAIIGTNVKYAPYVEFGTSKQGAQPYLYKALASNTSKIKKDIVEAVRNEIRGG